MVRDPREGENSAPPPGEEANEESASASAATTYTDLHREQKLGQLAGLVMLLVATAVFLYYTAWTLLMPFVDPGHPLHDLFPPRVWAIRIPVILILLGSAVVGSFLGMVMIRSNRKKAAKAKAAASKKKA